MSAWQISRRTMLRGLGTAVALPLLDSMAPALARAGEAKTQRAVRMAFIYVPNGVNMADWTPLAEGPDYEAPYILAPLRPLREEFMVLTNLAQDKGRAHGDGAGDHARSAAVFLTGVQPHKTEGADIKAGISVDQLAASRIGRQTKLPSLELGCDSGPHAGGCDSGYSCVYSSNISWRSETTPAAKEVNPRLVFERLFSDDSADVRQNRAKRLQNRRSILDFVLEDAQGLKARLGVKDQRKMDEYLTGIREIEVQLARVEREPKEDAPNLAKPAGIPREFPAHMRLMLDLMALAFQGDVTRISSFVVAHEASGQSYPYIGVPDSHHSISHHGGDPAKKAKIAKINNFHVTQLAYFLERLRSIKEGEHTLLDNSMIVYGSGISDGDLHNHNNLPVLLAGRGGGTIQTGRHVRFGQETPLNNLYMSMLDRLDVDADKIGDSNGRLNLAG